MEGFLTLAEVGIGFAGFSGIVVALTRRDEALSPGQAFFVRELILNSLAVIFLALLPVGLSKLQGAESVAWQALSGLHAGLVVFVAWPSLYLQVRKLKPDDRDPRIYLLIASLQVAIVSAQILNASGLLFAPSAGVYFLSLCGVVGIGAIHFARLLFARLL